MFLYGSVRQGGEAVAEFPDTPFSRFGQVSAGGLSSRAGTTSGRLDFADYFIRIQNLRSAEECETCFAGIMEDDILSQEEKASRMYMLLSKWGELAPRQAIQKVLHEDNLWKISSRDKNSSPWLSCVFFGWAGKAPEAAVAFFKESDDSRIKKDRLIPRVLMDQWSAYSPRDAWNWLASQDVLSFPSRDSCKMLVINNMLWRDSDGLPEFIAGLDERDAKLYGSRLWRNWFGDHPDSPEQMASLSGENRMAAILGSISGKAKGDLDAVSRELSGYKPEEQQKILFELAPGLISGDKTERESRLRWLMANAPGALLQESVKNSLQDWFFEKRVEAREVLDNLPEGKEKEALMQAFKSSPVIQYF